MLRTILFLAFAGSVVGDEVVRITNASAFKSFAEDVNEGTNYLGTTVYLDSDLSLSDIIEPIGNYYNYFLGTFDGQGYIISNLTMNSSSEFTGLFGYSRGLTIRNVVLDSSCSMTNSYSGTECVYAGGIIGWCAAYKGQCNIENSVNIADVTFIGNISGSGYILFLGGVIGYITSSGYNTYVKNCVNYGSVTHSGTSYYSDIGGITGYLHPSSDSNPCYVENCANYGSIVHSGTSESSFIGGIVGFIWSSSLTYKYIYNCLNYGAITHNGTSLSESDIGGIVGDSSLTYVENCVSAGKISTQNTSSGSRIGSIVGAFHSGYIKYCYYTSDVGVSKAYVYGTPTNTETSPSPTTVDLDLVSNLNNYAPDSSWNKWLLNEKNVSISFVVNYEKELNLNSQIILLPDLSADGVKRRFSGWYKNPLCTELFQKSSVTEAMTLYGLYGKIVTVTFDMNGGNNISITSKIVAFNSPYGPLPTPTKEGHIFLGWFAENNESVTNETIVNKLEDYTLYAQWEDISEVKNENESDFIFTFVGIIVIIVVIIVIVVVIVALFIIFKKIGNNIVDRINKKCSKDIELDNRLGKEYCRIVTTSMEEKETMIASEDSRGILTNLYPQGYTRPSMRDALLAARLTKEQANSICEACENAAQKASKGEKEEKITEDDAAAIAMYTYDFGSGDFENNPYRIINKSLVGRNYNKLQRASGLLYLVMAALRKLPRYMGKTLYRGVRGEVNSDKYHYRKGNVITWPALSSTSPDVESTKTFLAKGSESGKATGTLFIIDGGWGYDIQPYSLFPDEEEILLEPERQFEVTGVLETEGVTIINLKMLDTPLSIPEVFGDEY